MVRRTRTHRITLPMLSELAFLLPKGVPYAMAKYAHTQSVQIRLAKDPVVGRLELDMRSRLGILWHVDQVLAIEAL